MLLFPNPQGLHPNRADCRLFKQMQNKLIPIPNERPPVLLIGWGQLPGVPPSVVLRAKVATSAVVNRNS